MEVKVSKVKEFERRHASHEPWGESRYVRGRGIGGKSLSTEYASETTEGTDIANTQQTENDLQPPSKWGRSNRTANKEVEALATTYSQCWVLSASWCRRRVGGRGRSSSSGGRV